MKKKISQIVLFFFIVTIASVGLTFSSCQEAVVEPGEPKYCPIKIVNYHLKSDGTAKDPEVTYGIVPANASGLCPDPKLEWKNQ